MLRALIPLVCSFALLAAAERPDPATDIAAAMIAERAAELRAAGHQRIARRLEELSGALGEGSVTLAQALEVTQLAGALTALGAPASAAQGAPPTTSVAAPGTRLDAAQVGALLDGQPLPPAEPPPAPVAAQDPPPIPAPPIAASATALRSTVLAVIAGDAGAPTQAAIGVGSADGVVLGHRFVIRHGDAVCGILEVAQVRAQLSMGVVLPPQPGAAATVAEGDAAVAEEPSGR